MHELSLVLSIVETVTDSLTAYPAARVLEVRLRVGALAAVEEEALQFCYGMASEGAALAGSRLVVQRLPVVLHCAACAQDVELDGVQSFHCPRCGGAEVEMKQGKELEIDSIELDDGETNPGETPEALVELDGLPNSTQAPSS
jgi:hydrogenase nickel incorporation protein HypA/HybF